MKEYKAYIFDLYGTLVDIWTDEEDPALWQWLAGYYGCFGAYWEPDGIRQRYHELVRELEEEIAEKRSVRYPEIRLEDVFIKLLFEKSPDAFAERCADPDDWAFDTANAFRIFSRRRFTVYEGAEELLGRLREQGKGVHLLSNAQAVFTLPELKAAGLYSFFDSIYIASDKGMKKPQKEFMQLLLIEQGLEPEDCLMIGNDFQTDMEIAASCDVDAVFINSFGYTKDRIEKENVHGALVAGSLAELLGMIPERTM